MADSIGRMDRRAEILRRAPIGEPIAGQVLGDFEVAFTRFCEFKWNSSRLANEAAQAQPFDDVEIKVRADSQTRTITNEDRIRIDGMEYAIEGHPIPYRLTGRIHIRLTSRIGG